jgi:hypothetical protein
MFLTKNKKYLWDNISRLPSFRLQCPTATSHLQQTAAVERPLFAVGFCPNLFASAHEVELHQPTLG